MSSHTNAPPSLLGFFSDVPARWTLRRCAAVGRGVRARGRIWVHGRGRVHIGDGVVLDGAHHPIELHALASGSEIWIGDGVHISGGASIEAVVSVRVGARSRIGSFSRLMDNHFHPPVGDRHFRPPSAPVVLGEDVAIGARAIPLAGARGGDGATARPGPVITRRGPGPRGGEGPGPAAVVGTQAQAETSG